MQDIVFDDDKLSLVVKSEKADEVEKAYGAFGWKPCGERLHLRARSAVAMNFTRKHQIPQKDRLQLLQVRYEVALNFTGSVKRRVRARVAAFCLFLSLLGVLLALYGVYTAFTAAGNLFLSCGVLLISAGAVLVVLAVVLGIQMYVYYSSKYGTVAQVLRENIITILGEARKITGGGYADKEQNA